MYIGIVFTFILIDILSFLMKVYINMYTYKKSDLFEFQDMDIYFSILTLPLVAAKLSLIFEKILSSPSIQSGHDHMRSKYSVSLYFVFS